MESFEIVNGITAERLEKTVCPIPAATITFRGKYKKTLLKKLCADKALRTEVLASMRQHGVISLSLPLHLREMPNQVPLNWTHVRRIDKGVTQVMSLDDAKEILSMLPPQKEQLPEMVSGQNPVKQLTQYLDKHSLTQEFEKESSSANIWDVNFALLGKVAVILDDANSLHRGKYIDSKSQNWHAENWQTNRLVAFAPSGDGKFLFASILETTESK